VRLRCRRLELQLTPELLRLTPRIVDGRLRALLSLHSHTRQLVLVVEKRLLVSPPLRLELVPHARDSLIAQLRARCPRVLLISQQLSQALALVVCSSRTRFEPSLHGHHLVAQEPHRVGVLRLRARHVGPVRVA
jgi:hypothetical protein